MSFSGFSWPFSYRGQQILALIALLLLGCGMTPRDESFGYLEAPRKAILPASHAVRSSAVHPMGTFRGGGGEA